MGIQLDRVINENYEKLNTVDQHILQFVVRAQNFCQNFSKFLSKTFPKYFRKKGRNHIADFRPFLSFIL